jgi:hypothetical protein
MIEIVVVWLLARQLRKSAMLKGRDPSAGWFAMLWFGGEFVGAFGAALLGARDLAYVFALLGAAAGGAAAMLIVKAMAPAPGWVPGMLWAGYCKRCKANVWLTPDASRCQNGHGAEYVKGLYVPQPQPQQAAAPDPFTIPA